MCPHPKTSHIAALSLAFLVYILLTKYPSMSALWFDSTFKWEVNTWLPDENPGFASTVCVRCVTP